MTDTTSVTVAASPPEPAAYDPVLRALHWITAIAFLVALAIGIYASTQARPALRPGASFSRCTSRLA